MNAELPEVPAARKATTAVNATLFRLDGSSSAKPDKLATEEPMSIRVGGPGQANSDVTVTMRTPGYDFELAVGFLWAEGILTNPNQVREVKYCAMDEEGGDAIQRYNIVTVRTSHEVTVTPRAFTTNSSCGVCGTQTLDDLASCSTPIPMDGSMRISVATLLGIPAQLQAKQKVFALTGGLHAAAIVDAAGRIEVVREDVGRHNAVDKVVGRLVLDRQVPAHNRMLFVSGRTSYEIVQKAAVAGIAIVAGVSAPSSLAVETADRMGISLAGFVRGGSLNAYTHPERFIQ
jgi:FdhD protein